MSKTEIEQAVREVVEQDEPDPSQMDLGPEPSKTSKSADYYQLVSDNEEDKIAAADSIDTVLHNTAYSFIGAMDVLGVSSAVEQKAAAKLFVEAFYESFHYGTHGADLNWYCEEDLNPLLYPVVRDAISSLKGIEKEYSIGIGDTAIDGQIANALTNQIWRLIEQGVD